MPKLTPIEGDPFHPAQKGPNLVPVDGDPFAEAGGGTSTDVLKSAGVGVGQGIINTLGMIPDAVNLLQTGADKLIFDRLFGKASAEARAHRDLGTSKQIKGAVEGVTGKFYEPKTTPGNYAKTVGEFLPGALLGPGGLFRNAMMAGTAGVGSEAAGQATKGTNAEPWARLAGGLVGGLAPSAVSRAVSPFKITDKTQLANIATLGKEGVPLTAGQKTGSGPLQYAESYLGDAPFAGNQASKFQAAQSDLLTKAAMSKAGVKDSLVDPSGIAKMKDYFKTSYDDLAKRTITTMDKPFANDIGQAVTTYVSNSIPGQRPKLLDDIISVVQDHASNNGGKIPPASLQNLLSRIKTAARGTNDNELKRVLVGLDPGDVSLRSAFEGMIKRTAAPGVAKEWETLNGQYRNSLALKKVAKSPAAADGTVTPMGLGSAVASVNPHGYLSGSDELSQLARAARATMKPLPNSGTAQRYMQAGQSGAGIGGIFGAVDPTIALASIFGPGIMGRGIMSKIGQGYLGNQAIPNMQRALPMMAGPEGLAAGVLNRAMILNPAIGQIPAARGQQRN